MYPIVYILYRHITYNMASQINASNNVLPAELPTGIGGNAAVYQEKMTGAVEQSGGQGYGFEGKMIAPGVAEVSSYKGGSKRRRQSKKRRQQRKSKRQQKSRRR